MHKILLCCLMFVVVPAFAEKPVTRPTTERILDMNLDGTLDEADDVALGKGPLSELVRERYERIDSNHDGVIDPEEYSFFRDRMYTEKLWALQRAKLELVALAKEQADADIRAKLEEAAKIASDKYEAYNRETEKYIQIALKKLPFKYVDIPVGLDVITAKVKPLDPHDARYRDQAPAMVESMRRFDRMNRRNEEPFLMDDIELFTPTVFARLYKKQPTTKP